MPAEVKELSPNEEATDVVFSAICNNAESWAKLARALAALRLLPRLVEELEHCEEVARHPANATLREARSILEGGDIQFSTE